VLDVERELYDCELLVDGVELVVEVDSELAEIVLYEDESVDELGDVEVEDSVDVEWVDCVEHDELVDTLLPEIVL
jgi:hypothetical protein